MRKFHARIGGRTMAALATGAMLVAGAGGARADVKYTMQMTMNTDGGQPSQSPYGTPKIRTTTYLKDMRERDEQVMDMGPITMNTVTITQCDKHQELKLDPDLKIYTVSPIGVFNIGIPPTRGQGGRPESHSGKSGTGHVINTFNVQDLGKDEITNIKAHHYMITMRNQSSGCAGDSDTTMKMEVWVAAMKASLNCPERYANVPRTLPGLGGSDCSISYEMKGDVTGLRDTFANMMVKEIIYKDDKPLLTRELREHSTAILDDSLFDVPSDFKQVSDEDFSKAQSKAMMRNMMHGHGFSAPPSDDNQDSGQNGGQPQGDQSNSNGQPTPPPSDNHHHGFKMPHFPF